MKHILLPALALSLLLCSCSTPTQDGAGLTDTQTPQVQTPTETPALTQTPQAQIPVETPGLTEVEYEIQRQDQSIYDSGGNLLVKFYYDLVQLTGDRPEEASVNQSLREDSAAFFTANGSRSELETMALSMPDYAPYWNTAEVEVVQNGAILFSVCITTDWYMGGVANRNYYGLTYRLDTGEKLDLTDLTDQDSDGFATQVRGIVKDYMKEHSEVTWADNAEQVVDETPLEDIVFWVDDGEIVVSFATYTLAAGAYGPAVIPTGITAELT